MEKPEVLNFEDSLEVVEDVAQPRQSQNNDAVNKTAVAGTTAIDYNELMMRLRTKPLHRKNKKVGRNDSCPCGSGKKYKNCCLKTGEYEGLES